MHRRKRNLLKSLVLGFAVAALAAPTALGEPRGPGNPAAAGPIQQSSSPDDRSLYRGSAPLAPQIVSSDDRSLFRGVETPSTPVSVTVSSPDDRSLFRGVETPSTPVSVTISSPDDRSLFRGVETASTPVNITVSSPSASFQWDDAGLGAALTLVLVLLLGGASILFRLQRRRIAAF